MIRQIKKQARSIVLGNYQVFLVPTLLYIFSAFVMSSSSLFFHNENIFKTNLFLGSLLLGLFFVFCLCVSPLSVFLFFKAAVGLVNKQADKEKHSMPSLSFRDMVKIAAIQLVPNLAYTLWRFLNGFTQQPSRLISAVFAGFCIYLSYKFFVCNYYYVSNRDTIKSTLVFSFETMKGKFGKYLLLTVSFELWYLAVVALTLLVSDTFHIGGVYKTLLLSVGCGVYLYLLPYQYTAYTLFIKNILSVSKNKRKKNKT